MVRIIRSWLLVIVICLLAAGLVQLGSPAGATSSPTLKLRSTTPIIDARSRKTQSLPISFSTNVFVEALGGDFEVRATRPDYATPISLEQWIDGGATKVPLPSSMDDQWLGFQDFIHYEVRNSSNTVVLQGSSPFCPAADATYRTRVESDAALTGQYPTWGCGARNSWIRPFTIGSVWGLDYGWQVQQNLSGSFSGPNGAYTLDVSIGQPYVDQFGIGPANAEITQTINVTSSRAPSARTANITSARRSDKPARVQYRGVTGSPRDLAPDPSTLPDLIPLPAYTIVIMHVALHDKDYLRFGAMVWNDGPSDLVVSGNRPPGQPTMDATQHFFDTNHVEVGSAPVGELEYDPRKGHDHWHFLDFARYTLLDTSMQVVTPSQKEGFCLGPTDPMDLTAPGAQWFPVAVGLGQSVCGAGDPNATSILEFLDAGWGDDYLQAVAGQAFNITHVPNGHYFIQVQANAAGSIYERDLTNNVSLREVILKGKRGARKVVVPPYPIA